MKLTSPAAALLAAALAVPGAAQAATATQSFSLVDSTKVLTISATGTFEERNPAWAPGATAEPEWLSFCAEATYSVVLGPVPTRSVYRADGPCGDGGTCRSLAAFWETHRPVVHGNVTARWCNLPDIAEGVPDPRNGTVYTSFTTQWNGFLEWGESAYSDASWSSARYRFFMETRSGTSGSGPLFSEARIDIDGDLLPGAAGLPPSGWARLGSYGHDAHQHRLSVEGPFALAQGKAGTVASTADVAGRITYREVQGRLPAFTMVDSALPVVIETDPGTDESGSPISRYFENTPGSECPPESPCPVTATLDATLQPSPSRDGRFETWSWEWCDESDPTTGECLRTGSGTEERYNFWTSHRTTFSGTVTIHKPSGPVTFGVTTHSNLSSGYNTYFTCTTGGGIGWNGEQQCTEVWAEASYDYFIPTVESGAGAPDFVDGGGWMGGIAPWVASDVIPKLPASGTFRFDFRGPRDASWWTPCEMHLEGTYRAR